MIIAIIRRKALLLIAILLCFCMGIPCSVHGAVDASLLTDLDQMPGVKTFNFAIDPVRENIPSSTMVDPEYSIKLMKELPDEYFGIPTGQQTDSSTGETITGLFVQKDGGNTAKGACGCIYRNMFQYKGQWIDVKTTYMDWQYQVKKSAFMCGGFANYKWKSLWYLEMKHEFFLAGTNTPVQVKGYLEYADVDNSQGMLLTPGEYGHIWVNSSGTVVGYRNIPAHTDINHGGLNTHQLERDMLCIQAKTDTDIPEEGESGYNRQDAARTTFAYTFSGNTLHTALIDDDTAGLNVMYNSSRKHVPSALPEEGSPEITKRVSDQDETDVISSHARSWQQWTYRIRAAVPMETEPGNMLRSFSIRDEICPALDIVQIRVMQGGEDVSDAFAITTADNLVTARADSVNEAEFYGCIYELEITVKVQASKDEMMAEELLNEDFEGSFDNTASVVYETGSGENEVETNSTDTTVQYEKEGDLLISKRISTEDIYNQHGDAVFIFRLEGTTASGKHKVYNRAITMDGTSGTVRFRNVPEGTYTCSEYDTFRFNLAEITDVTGGVVRNNSVDFTVDGSEVCRATFRNSRKSWGNYSDSSVIINRLGTDNN